MSMPHLNCTEGDVVFVRATVLEAAADCFKLRVEDFPTYAITFYAPSREIAKQEDIERLLAPRWDRVNAQNS
jgi:hypothetical protein